MRSVQDLHYNDYDYLKDPVVEKPAPDLNDDADLEKCREFMGQRRRILDFYDL